MPRLRLLSFASATLALTLTACGDPAQPAAASVVPALTRTDATPPGVHRQYGTPLKLGNGMARTYVLLDEKNGRVPLEVGVALDEKAMEGLPAPMSMNHGDAQPGEHVDMHMYLLDMPAQNPTPYKFVELDWNPAGHEPPGIWDAPHFDFHFYTVPVAVRNSILPTDPQFAAKAGKLPAPDFRPLFYLDPMTAFGVPPEAAAVPQMGVHWIDPRSPELQGMAGHPENYKPFTTTFIYGSWDGKFIFVEPMITRAHIMAKRDATDPAVRDQIIPVPTAQRYEPAGYYPSAYRIMYDAQAKEYRIAMTQLSWRE
jgi:hypothetical protein